MPYLLRTSCRAKTMNHALWRAGQPVWLLAALALSACGGGGGQSPEPSPAPPVTGTPSPPSPQSRGTVVVQVTTTDGASVPDIDVAINGGFDGRWSTTDANGEVRFTEVPAGEARTNTSGRVYHPAGSRFTVVGNAVTTVPIVVESVTEAIPVVLAARTAPSPDGSTMSLELDIAVLDEQGVARETLTAVDFGLDGDCGWNWCLINADGTDPNIGYSARVEDADLVPVPTWSRPALSTAVLLDQSKNMAEFDPAGLRVSGLASFLGSITAPDSVMLASYYDSAVAGDVAAPRVTQYGPFTSDSSGLISSLASLPGQETGRNTMPATRSAVAEVVQFTSSNAPGDPSSSRRSIVVVDTEPSASSGAASCSSCTCQDCADALQAARDAGISVVAIGKDYSYAFELAELTGNVSVQVDAPEQLLPVFRGLESIISGSLGFNRVRVVLDSTPGGLQPGRLLTGWLSIRIGPNTKLEQYVRVPIGQN
jgi:hypothetical protein